MKEFGFNHFAPFMEKAASAEPSVVAVAGAANHAVLKTCLEGARHGLVRCLLFDEIAALRKHLESTHIPEGTFEIRDSQDPATDAALSAGREEADIVMKGRVSSGAFLKALLSDDAGLTTGRRLSHLGFFDVPSFPRLLGMTDGGINVDPDFETRVEIVRNAVEASRAVLGRTPRLALVAAVEKVQSNMPVTRDWAAIAKMADRGEFGEAFVDGPLGLDNALDGQAAATKGISGEVAGNADIVVVPDIEAGNLMGKTLTYLANAPMAGLVLGARVPVILNSRADSATARMASLILAATIGRAGS
ncbi:MAG: bifunctional enoyl-CoA hydratase/phosphate acetyltransferase [Bacillota bacterium]